MSVEETPHEWSKDALLAKAQRYAEIMLQQDRSDWQFGFWSALLLEILTRAALSNISPTLIADGKDWSNTYYALGYEPNIPKFSPKSSDTSELLKRAENIFPEFTREMLSFSITHINRRNNELHSGALPFDDLGSAIWLPKFYECAEVLLEKLDESLEFLFGPEEAKAAKTHVQALKDEAAKAVKGTINACKTLWSEKGADEKQKLGEQAKLLASRHIGHRVLCPACNNMALVQGSPIGAPTQDIDGDMVIEKQPMLPSSFECTACGLKISGYSKLMACELGDTYTSKSTYDATEYFGVEPENEWYGMEDDNNEP